MFHDEKALEAAIDDLLEYGFDRADVSLLASEQAVVEKLGHAYRKVSELEDDSSAARVAYAAKEDYGAAEGGLISGLVYVGALAGAGAVVASGGALTAVLIAAAVSGGAGGAVGFGLARWLDRQRGRRLHEQLEKGGLLVWVHAATEAQEARAIDVLKRHKRRGRACARSERARSIRGPPALSAAALALRVPRPAPPARRRVKPPQTLSPLWGEGSPRSGLGEGYRP